MHTQGVAQGWPLFLRCPCHVDSCVNTYGGHMVWPTELSVIMICMGHC
jgi:hypothetical protein